MSEYVEYDWSVDIYVDYIYVDTYVIYMWVYVIYMWNINDQWNITDLLCCIAEYNTTL